MPLNPKRLIKPVKKLRKLVTDLDRQPAPQQVHDLRTTSRRFEAAFEALSLGSEGVGKSVMKHVGRCRKRAGKVRDMDVLTQYASSVHLTSEEDCRVQLLEHLGARRLKYSSKLFAEVRRLRSVLRKQLKHTAAILDDLTQTDGDSAVGPKAAAAALSLAVQLAAPRTLDRGNLHPYRLKVKELRNVLQMAGSEDNHFVDDLAKVKDAIGEWHDWEELLSIASKELNHGTRCELVAELKRIAARKYDHALALANELRSNYLQNTETRGNGSAAESSVIPRPPVLEAIAGLAG